MAITPRVYIDFDRDGSWTEVTAYIETAATIGGMSVVDNRIADIGTCTLRAINTDRRWSPDNAGSPYYPYLLPNRPVKIEATDGVTTWPVWRGFTASIAPDPDPYGSLYATIECVDILALLQTYGISLPTQENILPGDLVKLVTSGALRAPRATGYLDFAGNAANGNTVTVGAVTYRFVTALAQANDVLIGDDAVETAENLIAAIHRDEGSGTLYHASTARHPQVTAAIDGEDIDIPTAGVAQGFAIGRFDNGNMYYEGQRIKVNTGGLLSQFELWFSNRGGTPVGDVKWAWYDAREGIPGPYSTLYEEGTFTPVASEPAWNTITAAGTTYLTPGHYFLYLSPQSPQTTGNYWVVLASDGNAGDVYADGAFDQLQADPPGAWTEWPNQDMTLKVTLAPRPRVTLTANARGAWGNAIALEADGANLATNTQLITDGDMEAADASAWSAHNSGALSKETGTPHGGSNVLRVTENGADYPSAYQADVITTGNTYRLTGYARGDGNANPFIFDSAALWTGTSSTDWQRFDVVFTAVNDNLPSLASSALNGTGYYVEWDDVVLSSAVLSGGVDYPDGLLDVEAGLRALSQAGEDWSEDTNALSALTEIAQAEFGLLWVAPDGTLTFRDRDYLFLRATAAPDLTLNDDHNIQFATLSVDDVKNRVVVTYTPYAELPGVVVARAQEPICVLSSRVKKPYKRWNPSDDITSERGLSIVRLNYIDVETGQIASATDLEQPLTPGSDYRVHYGKAGVGIDWSGKGWVGFALALTGSGVEVHLTNNQSRHLWVHGLQVRGTARVKYDPITIVIEDVDSQAEYGRRELPFHIPLLSDNIRDYAVLLGQYLLGRSKSPFLRVGLVGFSGVEQVGGVDVYGITIGDVIQASETQTGVSGQTFLVIGLQYAFAQEQPPQALFYLARLDDIPYGIYDDPELGVYNQTHYAL